MRESQKKVKIAKSAGAFCDLLTGAGSYSNTDAMSRLKRFTALLTLTAFVGLSAVESFHQHSAKQTEANCAVCQIAHRTPTLISKAPSLGFQGVSLSAPPLAVLQSYVQFVFVSHGLSPPVL